MEKPIVNAYRFLRARHMIIFQEYVKMYDSNSSFVVLDCLTAHIPGSKRATLGSIVQPQLLPIYLDKSRKARLVQDN